jgi:hypothetical protein
MEAEKNVQKLVSLGTTTFIPNLHPKPKLFCFFFCKLSRTVLFFSQRELHIGGEDFNEAHPM